MGTFVFIDPAPCIYILHTHENVDIGGWPLTTISTIM